MASDLSLRYGLAAKENAFCLCLLMCQGGRHQTACTRKSGKKETPKKHDSMNWARGQKRF